MVTLREAAQQALEALEYHRDKGIGGIYTRDVCENLRAALAEPVQEHTHEWFSTGAMESGQMRCIHCGAWGQEAPPQPAEPVQPVAWMDSDTVYRLAREAGYIPMQFTGLQTLERFAALVAAAEREACAKVCDELAALNRSSSADSMWQWGECAAAIRSRT